MNTDSKFDLAVLGGGISGLAVALLAAEVGQSVCLIEKSSCGLAASNNSLRIIHGGLRYLQKLDFPRIVHSVADQVYCLKKWPELVKPLRCIAPLSGKGLKRTSLAKVAALLYSCFLGALNSPLSRPYVKDEKTFNGARFLEGLAPDGFLVWEDAILVSPEALVDEMLHKFSELGGKIYTETRVLSLKDKVTEVEVSCSTSNQNFTINASKAVNCLGAWVQELGAFLEVKWCIAFNIVLNKQLSSDFAFGCDGEMGRYFFFVPRGDKTVVGTGYVGLEGSIEGACPKQSDVELFLISAARAAPKTNLTLEDIYSIEFGVLPMKGLDKNAQPRFFGGSQITKKGNVVHLLSTKYTTFRSQAIEIMKLLK